VRRALLMLSMMLALAACGVLGIKSPAPEAFPHTKHADKGINCRVCHAGVGQSNNADGTVYIPRSDSCLKCHKKPHDKNDCSTCHGLGYVREAVRSDVANLKFDHKAHVARDHGQCVRCHRGILDNSDHVRPTMAVCLSCHAHQDQFSMRNCDQCHKDLHGERLMPSSHVVHEGDWLREHGDRAASERDLCQTCHQERFCASCHGVTVPALPEKQAFDDPLRAGVHRAGFMSRHPLEARTQPGMCTTCHSEDSCKSCHDARGVSPSAGAQSPHPPGWLGARGGRNDHGRAAWDDPAECASCHSGGGEKLCVGCHKVGGMGGNPHKPGWTSNKRPLFDEPCRQCHGDGQ